MSRLSRRSPRSGIGLGCCLGAAVLLLSCSASSSRDTDSTDPFDDPFFREGFGKSSVDEVWEQPSPSVGWLANESLYDRERAEPIEPEEGYIGRERAAAGAGEVVEAERRTAAQERGFGEHDEDGGVSEGKRGSGREKSFSEKAQEATLATMSVLIGAGMAALPYLLGT
jgi:hypothetical protein